MTEESIIPLPPRNPGKSVNNVTVCYYICPECGHDWVNPSVENAPDTCPNCNYRNVNAGQVELAATVEV